jgi:hypothetical protein
MPAESRTAVRRLSSSGVLFPVTAFPNQPECEMGRFDPISPGYLISTSWDRLLNSPAKYGWRPRNSPIVVRLVRFVLHGFSLTGRWLIWYESTWSSWYFAVMIFVFSVTARIRLLKEGGRVTSSLQEFKSPDSAFRIEGCSVFCFWCVAKARELYVNFS